MDTGLVKFKKMPKRKPVKATVTKSEKELITVKTNVLKELNFVIGGIFQNYEKSELLVSIIENGGNVTGTVSKRTNYLVAGEKVTPTKLVKAKELETPVINELDFIELLKK